MAIKHYLEHSTKNRWYKFLPQGETVQVEKYENSWLAERLTMSVDKARSYYLFLTKQGYKKW